MVEKMTASILRPIKEEHKMLLEYLSPDGERSTISFEGEASLLAKGELLRAAFCQINGGYDEGMLNETLADPQMRQRLEKQMDVLEQSMRTHGTWVVFFENSSSSNE